MIQIFPISVSFNLKSLHSFPRYKSEPKLTETKNFKPSIYSTTTRAGEKISSHLELLELRKIDAGLTKFNKQ
jgi:hypothetical protein